MTDPETNDAFLPYIHNVIDHIGRFLKKHGIKTIYKPTRKIHEHLISAKDKRDLTTSSSIYRIPCSCDQGYIGTIKRSVNTKIAEHKKYCHCLQWEKSSVAKHALVNPEHKIFLMKQKYCQLPTTTSPAYIVRL